MAHYEVYFSPVRQLESADGREALLIRDVKISDGEGDTVILNALDDISAYQEMRIIEADDAQASVVGLINRAKNSAWVEKDFLIYYPEVNKYHYFHIDEGFDVENFNLMTSVEPNLIENKEDGTMVLTWDVMDVDTVDVI
jgi:hypothetical protein